MPTASYVQPPPNNSVGPKLDTRTRVIGSDTKHAYSLAAGRLHKRVTANLTRPSTTTVYTPGDAVTDVSGVALTFEDVGRDATEDGGRIVSAICGASSDQAVKPDLELWLCVGASAPTADTDNDAFTPASILLIGVVHFRESDWLTGNPGSTSACVGVLDPSPEIPYVCGANGDVFGLVVVRNTYAPTSGGLFQFWLTVAQD